MEQPQPEPTGDHGQRPGPLLLGQLGKVGAGGAGVPPALLSAAGSEAAAGASLPRSVPRRASPAASPRLCHSGRRWRCLPSSFSSPAARGGCRPCAVPARAQPGSVRPERPRPPRRRAGLCPPRWSRRAPPWCPSLGLLKGSPGIRRSRFAGAVRSFVFNPGLSSCWVLLNPRSCAGGVTVSAEITSPRICKESEQML